MKYLLALICLCWFSDGMDEVRAYVPFGACWKEKQAMSLTIPRSGSSESSFLHMSCSDRTMLILPLSS
jgi:hypothetical protein